MNIYKKNKSRKLIKTELITKVMSVVVLKVPGNKNIIINTKKLC